MSDKVPPKVIDVTLRSDSLVDGLKPHGRSGERGLTVSPEKSALAVTMSEELTVTGEYRSLLEQGRPLEAQSMIERIAEKVRKALESKKTDLAENLIQGELMPLFEITPSLGDKKYLSVLIENFRFRIEKNLREVKSPVVVTGSIEEVLLRERPKFSFEEDGRFEALREIGVGGMGKVYEVLDHERGGGIFALKTMNITPRSADDLLALRREFRQLKRLNHPNLVKYHELFERNGTYYFTMDKVDGTDFHQYLSDNIVKFNSQRVEEIAVLSISDTISVKDGELLDSVEPKVDLEKLNRCVAQLVEGLTYMHQKGVVHRDIKPSNVLVRPDGKLVLIDFGLVRSFDTEDVEKSNSLILKGTPLYMAPEQVSDAANIGPAADWYAMGVMLYELLAGEAPFYDVNIHKLFEHKVKIKPKAPHLIRPGIPQAYGDLCLNLLKIDPRARANGNDILKVIGKKQESLSIDSTNSLSIPPVNALFVGREKELQVLQTAFEKVKSGEPVTVMAVGKSGVGKSKFVKEFAAREKKNDSKVMVLSGVCYEQEDVVFKALTGVMDALSQQLKNIPDNRVALYLPKDSDLLARVFPVLKRVPAIANFPYNNRQYEPLESKKRLFRAIREFLERLSIDNRLILVIDDLQWADKDSLELLKFVLNTAEAPNMLSLLTSREYPNDVGLELPGDFQVMTINELENNSAEELVQEMLKKSGTDYPRNTVELIVKETRSPYYLQELVRHVLASGTDVFSSTISLDDALRTRIEKLNPLEQKLLIKVCASGRPLPQQILFQSGTSDWSLNEFFRLVSSLRDEELVRTNGLKQANLIEPFHDRVRETALAILEIDEFGQNKVHEDLAMALQTMPQPDFQALASHWEKAGDLLKAYDYALKAAKQAEESLAFETAVNFYAKAIKLGVGLPVAEKSYLNEKYGEALDNLGRGMDAAVAYETAFEGAEDVDRLKSKAAGVLLRSGEVKLGLKMLENVLESNGMSLYKTQFRVIVAFLWIRFLLKIRGFDFVAQEEKNIPKEKLKLVDLLWDASSGLGVLKPVQANVYNSRMTYEALKAGELERIIKALFTESVFSSFGGSKTHERTDSLVKKIEEIDAKLNTVSSRMAVKMSKLGVEYMAGRFANSDGYYDDVQELALESKDIMWRKNTVDLFHFWTKFWLGDYKYLSVRAPELVAEAEKKGDKYAAISFKLGFPSLYHLAKDNPEEVERVNLEAISEWPGDLLVQGYSSDKGIIHAKLYKKQGEEAFRLISEQIVKLKKGRAFKLFQVIRMECFHMYARSALQIGGKEKLKQAEQATKKMLSENLPFANPLAKLVLAAIEFQRNQSSQSVQLLEEVIKEFGDQKMASFEASSKYQLGKMIGGDRGRELVLSALEWAKSEEIVKPESIFQMDAPGFEIAK